MQTVQSRCLWNTGKGGQMPLGSNNISRIRLIVQTISFIFINAGIFGIAALSTHSSLKDLYLPITSCHYLEKGIADCYFYNLQNGLTTGSVDLYIYLFVPTIIFIILILILGRIWCGWICPLGFAPDLLMRLRRALKIPYFKVPDSSKPILESIKYVALFLVIWISLGIGIHALELTVFHSSLNLPLCQVCPAKPLFTLWQMIPGILPTSTGIPAIAIFMLIVFIIGSLSIRRFYCRFCPIGAAISLFARTSTPQLYKDINKCTECGVCARCCPAGVTKVYEEKKEENVTAPECIMCFLCVELCPEDDCLKVNFFSRPIIKSKFSISKRKVRSEK